MAVSSGFFNSQNHDRLYDAEQVSSIFDGIISDGVYDGYGDAFNVTPNTATANTVFVDTGRAWFNHTWTLNDARIMLTLDAPDPMNPRVDAIVIDVDRRNDYRKNSIIAVTGPMVTSSGTDPQPPTMIHEDRHDQYPIAYVTRPAGDDGIVASQDIEIKVGTDVCPRVVGVLEALNDDQYWQQLEADFNDWWDGIKDLIGGDTEDSLLALSNRMDELEDKVDANTITDKGEIGKYQVLFTKEMVDAMLTGTTGNTGDMQSVNIPVSPNDDETVGRWILPDGCVACIRYENGGTNNEYVRTYIYNNEGVQITSTDSSKYGVVGSNDTSKLFVVNGFINADSYPLTIAVALYGAGAVATYTVGSQSEKGVRWEVLYGTVTITEDHVVSYNLTRSPTYSSETLSEAVASYDDHVTCYATYAAVIPNGDRIFVCSGQDDYAYNSENGEMVPSYVACGKITSEGAFVKGSELKPTYYTGNKRPNDNLPYGIVYYHTDLYYPSSGGTSIRIISSLSEITGWIELNSSTLSLTYHESGKPSNPSEYVTYKEGTFSTLNMSTKKYNTQTWNRTNIKQTSSSDFEYPNLYLLYDRGQTFANQDSFFKKIEMPDGTLDYILYGTTGIDHFIFNPLTGITVVENKLNTTGFTNFEQAATNKYCHRTIGTKEYFLVGSTLYML